MKRLLAIAPLLVALLSTQSVWAGQAEVRDVAIANNCPPKKVEVYQHAIGADGETIYRVTCTLPKVVGEATAPAADALMISCVQNLCTPTTPITVEKK